MELHFPEPYCSLVQIRALSIQTSFVAHTASCTVIPSSEADNLNLILMPQVKTRCSPAATPLCLHATVLNLSTVRHTLPLPYKTIILNTVLCGQETLSLTMREEHWLTMLENSVQRKIFGPNVMPICKGG